MVGDGLRLRVVEQGDPTRPTVVLVHGYPDNSTMWDGIAELLVDRFHVVRYDIRGAGGSDAPGECEAYRLDHLAADLAAIVRATSRGRPVHVVAHDWGSIQSWHAVTDPTYASLFASFTSISGPYLDHVAAWMRGSIRRLRIRPVLRQLARTWYIGAFQVPVLPELVVRLPIVRKYLGADRRDAVNGIELYRANMFTSAAIHDNPRRTDVPVMQLELTRDPFVRPELLRAAEPFCTALWRYPLPFDHWAPRTHPAAIADRVIDFVQHIEGVPASRELRAARVGGKARGEFVGRLVLVTGAGSGIGRATALAFAAGGADIIAVDIDEESAAVTVGAVRALGADGHVYCADVADRGAMAKLADHVLGEHGAPDIVMANAGIGMAGPFLDTTENDWRRIVDVNLLGVVHTLRPFASMLVDRGRGGHLVVTASGAAFTPWPVLSAYAATKAAVLSLAQSLRTELAPHGIGVSAICPGLIATNIVGATRFVGLDAVAEQQARRRMAVVYRRRRFAAERVADVVLRAVRDNVAVVPVTAEARLAAFGARLAPGLVRCLGGLGQSRDVHARGRG